MELIERMQKTEFGLVPEDWTVGTFGEFMDGFSSGMTPYRGNKEYYEGEFPWITSGELNYNKITDTREKITEDAIKKTNLKIIPPGTFLMAVTGMEAEGTRGSCAITGISATTNQSCMALYPYKGVLETSYLYHFYVNYGKELASKYSQGTKQQSYNAVTVKTLPIAFPKLPSEQQQIARALNETDNWIKSLSQLLNKKRMIKQGAMQKLLKPQRDWQMKKLGLLCTEAKSGGTPLSSNPKFYNGGIPFLSIADMTSQGKYIYQTSNNISELGLKNSASWIVPVNTIIYSMYASVGFCSINKIPLATSQAVINLIIDDSIDLEYLYYFLISIQKDILKYVGEGTQKNLSSKSVKDFDIYFPKSKEKQSAISTVLSDIDIEIKNLETKIKKAKWLKLGIMQQLLSGKSRFNSRNINNHSNLEIF